MKGMATTYNGKAIFFTNARITPDFNSMEIVRPEIASITLEITPKTNEYGPMIFNTLTPILQQRELYWVLSLTNSDLLVQFLSLLDTPL